MFTETGWHLLVQTDFWPILVYDLVSRIIKNYGRRYQ
jgi:hypothetical protein